MFCPTGHATYLPLTTSATLSFDVSAADQYKGAVRLEVYASSGQPAVWARFDGGDQIVVKAETFLRVPVGAQNLVITSISNSGECSVALGIDV